MKFALKLAKTTYFVLCTYEKGDGQLSDNDIWTDGAIQKRRKLHALEIKYMLLCRTLMLLV